MDILDKYFDDFTAEQKAQFEKLGTIYRDLNSQINVISRKDIDNIYEKHVLHSLSVVPIFDFFEGTQIMDLGTGGGFPGIPLAIFRPDVEFTLVDSVAKKTKVVEQVVEELGLQNVEVIRSRAEDLKGKSFDYVVTRAVARLSKLWQWSKPLIRRDAMSPDYPNGLIALKGGDLSEEISESQLRPQAFNIYGIFPEPYFEEKFILYIKK